MAVVDVHTHMISRPWLALLQERSDEYTVSAVAGAQAIHRAGAPFMTMTPGMLDYGMRIRRMDEAGVDLAVVSLTCPNVYWGGPDVSAEAARLINDDMAAHQRRHPDRLRWLASLPWQYPDRAVTELARACDLGASGVIVLAHVDGASLTASRFGPIWEEIDRRALPVLLHPTTPAGVALMDMQRYNLVAAVGFMFDTTLAVSRMILDGFFDRYRSLKVICAHAGGCLPFVMGRLDIWHECYEPVRETIEARPGTYADRLWADALVYTAGALRLTLDVFGTDRVLFGTDYPHKNGDIARCLAGLDVLPESERKMVRGENALRLFG